MERERRYADAELMAVAMVGVLPVMAVVAVVSPLAFGSPGGKGECDAPCKLPRIYSWS